MSDGQQDLPPRSESRLKPFLMIGFALVVLVAGMLIRGTDDQDIQPEEAAADLSPQPVCENETVCHLYDFVKFIEWPDMGAAEDLNICVIGGNFLGQDIYRLDKKPIRQSRVRILTEIALTQIGYCHVVILHKAKEKMLPDISQKLGGKPVLTISNIPDFVQKGGMIELMMEKGRLRFRLNRENIEKTGLKVSSKLLTISQ